MGVYMFQQIKDKLFYQPDKFYMKLLVFIFFLSLVDIILTYFAFSYFGEFFVEKNPIFSSLILNMGFYIPMIFFKIPLTLFLCYTCYKKLKHFEHRTISISLIYLVNILYLLVILLNIKSLLMVI